MQNYKIGYAGGVFDLFHIGHVNLLRRAKGMCDLLIVGVSTDELAATKASKPVIPFEQRMAVVQACRFVDLVMPQSTFDKVEMWRRVDNKFNLLFVGSDWQGTQSWQRYEEEFKSKGVEVVYLPYTKEISSTLIKQRILNEQK